MAPALWDSRTWASCIFLCTIGSLEASAFDFSRENFNLKVKKNRDYLFASPSVFFGSEMVGIGGE